nr:hypothetical protein [Pararhizobium sp. IMCC3301]
MSGLRQLLQMRLAEGISIRGLPSILEGVAEADAVPVRLTSIRCAS